MMEETVTDRPRRVASTGAAPASLRGSSQHVCDNALVLFTRFFRSLLEFRPRTILPPWPEKRRGLKTLTPVPIIDLFCAN
jgi:hypothetical protein